MPRPATNQTRNQVARFGVSASPTQPATPMTEPTVITVRGPCRSTRRPTQSPAPAASSCPAVKPPVSPAELTGVLRDGDLVISVCDNAHEELQGLDQIHWSVPDPVPAGTASAY